ncbi:unnamed protein product [Mesocestoides corti]|uniref:Apple domain-containing protein n=1 Tax=Mesocestoides corti TaxID=53468 RepID=A0A0R3UH21_MESCO|nr:unnamed protein product [Mesocestoides corti]
MTSRMSARSLSLLALALSLGYVASADLHLLNIKQSRVYASSVASGSAPEYAVDQELNSTGPTCFQSLPGVYDASEYSWLVVDLGIITRNISELRIALNPDVQSNTTLSSVEVFVTKNMHTVVHYGNSADTRLPWSSYKFCGSTSSGHLTATSAEVQCKYPLDGRWIILRRKLEPLVICLLAVYVEKYQDECFKMVNSTSREHISGFQFRLERHISLEQCRDSCLETPICQAIVFTRKSRRIGICRHFRSFMDESSSYIECGSRCHLEENVCHRGKQPVLLNVIR